MASVAVTTSDDDVGGPDASTPSSRSQRQAWSDEAKNDPGRGNTADADTSRRLPPETAPTPWQRKVFTDLSRLPRNPAVAIVYVGALTLCVGVIVAFFVRWVLAAVLYYSSSTDLIIHFFVCLAVTSIFPLFIASYVFWESSLRLHELLNVRGGQGGDVSDDEARGAIRWSVWSYVLYFCGVCVSMGITTIGNYSSDLRIKEQLYYFILEIVALSALWLLLYLLIGAAMQNVYAYRPQRAFIHFTFYRVLPGSAVGLLVEAFLLLAMMAEGQHSEYNNGSLPLYWSSGYGSFWGSLCVTCTCLSLGYMFGSGLLKLSDLEGSHIYDDGQKEKEEAAAADPSTASSSSSSSSSSWARACTGLMTWYQQQGVSTLKASLKYFYFIDMAMFLASVSMIWTTFDIGYLYAIGVAGMTIFGIHGLSIVLLRFVVKRDSLALELEQPWKDSQGKVPKKRHHFFLSHQQQTGGNQVHAICRELEIRGCNVWRDMDYDGELVMDAMKQGIKDSLIFVVFLTEKYWLSGPCMEELRCAIDELKNNRGLRRIVVIGELEARFQQAIFEQDIETYADEHVSPLKTGTETGPQLRLMRRALRSRLTTKHSHFRTLLRSDFEAERKQWEASGETIGEHSKLQPANQKEIEDALFGVNEADDDGDSQEEHHIIRFERKGHLAKAMYHKLMDALQPTVTSRHKDDIARGHLAKMDTLKSIGRHADYHAFISFADNGSRGRDVDKLVNDFRAFPAGKEIKWCIHHGPCERTAVEDDVRSSAVFFVYLTPDYFRSEKACRELDTAIELQKMCVPFVPPAEVDGDAYGVCKKALVDDLGLFEPDDEKREKKKTSYMKYVFEAEVHSYKQSGNHVKDKALEKLLESIKAKGAKEIQNRSNRSTSKK